MALLFLSKLILDLAFSPSSSCRGFICHRPCETAAAPSSQFPALWTGRRNTVTNPQYDHIQRQKELRVSFNLVEIQIQILHHVDCILSSSLQSFQVRLKKVDYVIQ